MNLFKLKRYLSKMQNVFVIRSLHLSLVNGSLPKYTKYVDDNLSDKLEEKLVNALSRCE